MEGMNRQEARRAAAIGRKHLDGGNAVKAIKFFEKSLRMFPDQSDVKALLERARTGGNSASGKQQNGHANNGTSSTSSSSGASSSQPRRRRAAPTEHEVPQREYTPEQAAGVKRVLKCKNFYDVLGVPREGASQAQIKKGYRKLALKFHPDKNAAPGADEAFKMINRAFSVLSDEEKKAHYDQFGDEEATPQAYRRRYRHGDDFDPDEIFNMFFGQGFARGGMGGPGVRVYSFGGPFGGFGARRRGQGQGQAQQQQGGIFQLLQLLPIIMLFLLSFFSYPQSQEAIFSLHRTSGYPIERATSMRGVIPNIKYFVRNDFRSQYARDRRTLTQVERLVEEHKVRSARRGCEQQKQARKVAMYKAKRSNNADSIARAHAMKMPSCDELQKLYSSNKN